MSFDTAIRVEAISKHYLMFEQPEDRLKQMVMPRIQRLFGLEPKRYFRDFAALNDVSLHVARGETVGILGRNGSGKSTLLQIICGTLQPSSGTVAVNGRVAALLELGAGFNPEFTGRENVFMNAAILGLSQEETAERFDDIARFADIGPFIDQPVKTYSSGMFLRLAFAVAINVDPDILVIDEALSVGDEAFQRKCFSRIEQIKARGCTILFVSHGAQTIVQLCDRAVLLDRGELILEGKPKAVVNQYQRLINAGPESAPAIRAAILAGTAVPDADAPRPSGMRHDPPPRQDTQEGYDPALVAHSRTEYDSRGAMIRDVRIVNSAGEQVNILDHGSEYFYEYVVDFSDALYEVGFGMLIKTVSGIEICGGTTALVPAYRLPQVAAGESYRMRFRFVCLLTAGTYFTNAGVSGNALGERNHHHRILDAMAFRVSPVEGHLATGMVDLGISTQIERVTG